MSAIPKVSPANVLIINTIKSIGGTDIPDAPDEVFALQTQAWGDLQLYIANALKLPVLQSDFEANYGKFEDEALVKEAIDLLKGLQDAAYAFGDIITESKDLIRYIGTDEAPDSLYAHAVWLASKIESTAMQVSNMAEAAIPMIEEETDPDKRAEEIQQLLTYPGTGMYTYAVDLNEKSLNFKDQLNTYLSDTFTPAKNAFENYFNTTEKTVLTDAQQVVADDTALINQLTAKVADDNAWLLGWCIGGSTGTVVSMFLPPLFFWNSLIVGGVECEEIVRLQTEIDQLNDQIAKLDEDKQKKSRLIADIQSLIDVSQQVESSSNAFLTAVTEMALGFGQCADDLQTIADTVTPEEVEDLPPFLQNVGLETAAADWEEIQVAANNFISCGQYIYQTS